MSLDTPQPRGRRLQRKLAAMTPEERKAREERIREQQLAREARERKTEIHLAQECEMWRFRKAACRAAWEERRSTFVDYAVMRVDAHFGFRKVDDIAQTPEEYLELRRHCGWPPILFREASSRMVYGRRAFVSREKDGMKYIMYISDAETHDPKEQEAFFDTVRRIYDSRSTTPQWNGARAHELLLFPKVIPEGCTCRWCRQERVNQPGSR